ncbi:hypothetical protein HHK36_015941 [Tetracentron sinense]|uniref:RING-type domain-containing protein n=1 Tax=Tetracentron sinense TaxID=13715 RepID=A0A835DEC7_TETSI|nr:hypothetical protein HHK36_015941 [Tetracentron sinense]
MSISPTEAQRSIPSSSGPLSQNPSFDHGLLQASEELVESPLSVSSDTQILGSVQISGPESTVDLSSRISGALAATAADSSGSSNMVMTDLRTPNGKKISSRQNHGTSTQCHSVGRGGMSSLLRGDIVDCTQSSGKLSQAVNSPLNEPTIGSVNFHGSATHSATRKNQMMNGNHLLNFHYDPITRPQPRIPPTRRQQKIKPYNKDLFLQANYKFVVFDSGNYALESMDPDKMLQWEDVICVRYSTPFPVQCPICLECPLCPQITSCGHIFCFPCILRYLLIGDEDHKGDCWKKCPLCFMMISLKDLYTIYIRTVKQQCVSDRVQFTLLTRQKDSLTPYHKNQQGMDAILCSSEELCDSFSKFTLTSDVELSVREAKSELDGWLARAESGMVDDLEKLPYICAAREQLEERKKYWSEYRAYSSSPPLRNHVTQYSNTKACKYVNSKTKSHVLSSTANANMADSEARGAARATPSVGLDSSTPRIVDGEAYSAQNANVPELFEVQERVLSSSYDESKSLPRHSNGPKDVKENESYTFYQAIDGQHLILHPLNMKCLLHYYGSYDFLPQRLAGRILQLETVTQSEAIRRRYRYLSHFSLTTVFQLCEIDLSELVPPDALSPFIDEIKKRENQRKRLAKKEHEEKVKADAATMHAVPITSNFARTYGDTTFSMDDFEALGSSTPSSSSPPVVGERKLFSNVTRLGFAAGYDSPSLKIEESSDALSNTEATSDASGPTGCKHISNLCGPRIASTQSFANVISTSKSAESLEVHNVNGFGKKGKKPGRVLLSTAGGRRY